MLRWRTEKFLSMETGRDAWMVTVRPDLVVEIAFPDIQKSPGYRPEWPSVLHGSSVIA